jgi:hypothetical protein
MALTDVCAGCQRRPSALADRHTEHEQAAVISCVCRALTALLAGARSRWRACLGAPAPHSPLPRSYCLRILHGFVLRRNKLRLASPDVGTLCASNVIPASPDRGSAMRLTSHTPRPEMHRDRVPAISRPSRPAAETPAAKGTLDCCPAYERTSPPLPRRVLCISSLRDAPKLFCLPHANSHDGVVDGSVRGGSTVSHSQPRTPHPHTGSQCSPRQPASARNKSSSESSNR